jgi:4-amino-4-deoxy-L-arabinose transferase-like glycosyltransferase
MKYFNLPLGLLVALLLGDAIILFSLPTWFWLRLPVIIGFVFVLPGLAWLPLSGWMKTDDGVERLVLLPGVSSLLVAFALLITVLLPGPFTEPVVLMALNLLVGVGVVAQFLWHPQPGHRETIAWPSREVLLGLLVIIGVAAFTRFFRLEYAEFHEDSLENMRLIVRAYKGEEYAPFLDSKGPIHWLLPASMWFLNGWLSEGLARLPTAITSLLLVPTVYVLGRRMTGREAVGVAAAGFVAVNGFFVAYARHVENQSLIIFWGAIALWWLIRYYKTPSLLFAGWAAFALAIGLIAHPDVLLYLPVAGFIVGVTLWDNRARWRTNLTNLVPAFVLFVGVSAVFYVPYLTDPNIGLVGQYFAQDRIGESLFYNRVENLFDQDKLYSSRFHAPILVLLFTWLLFRKFAAWGRRGYTVVALLVVAMVTAVVRPDIWVIAGVNVAFIPFALLTLLSLFLPQTEFNFKVLVLWMMAPLGALLFLAKDAADHIQVAYPAWAMLAALAVVDIWGLAGTFNITVRRIARVGLLFVLGLAVVLIVYYQYLLFLNTVTNYWQVKQVYDNNPNSVYGRLYGSIPRPRKIFSNPRLGGWKTVGYLYATGQLSGDFRSINESFAVPIWYTFQTPRSCYEDPDNYWVRRNEDGWPGEAADLQDKGYQITRIVQVDGQPKLRLYQRAEVVTEPEVIDADDYRRLFNLLATPGRFAEGDTISQPASMNFGDKLLLRGFDLPDTVTHGSPLPVTLYWEALAPMEVRYRGYVHLIDADGVRWGQHDDDPACRLLTSDMRPGQTSSRQFRVPVAPDIPPGLYQVEIGVYHPDTFAKLPIWDNLLQNSPGDSLVIGQVQVE